MVTINLEGNRIKCGRCGTEFDLNKNLAGCPLCGFGFGTNKRAQPIGAMEPAPDFSKENYLTAPPTIKLKAGKIFTPTAGDVWGSHPMFNDYFSLKFLTRFLAWKIHESGAKLITLNGFIEEAVDIIKRNGLQKYKGFPKNIRNPENLEKDSAVGRLVHHFLRTGSDMGFVSLEAHDPQVKDVKDIWSESWTKVSVTLNAEGLEFARLPNPIFDEGKKEQVLGSEEQKWLIKHLRRMDMSGYKDYSLLKEISEFLAKGRNGQEDLWNWFETNQKITKHIRATAQRGDPEQQIKTYAQTLAASRVSLLRELGIVRNNRNNYTVVGELK